MDYEQENLSDQFDLLGLKLPFADWRENASTPSLESTNYAEAEMFYSGEALEEQEGAAPGRLIIDSVPLISAHRGTQPDLILKWNQLGNETGVDVVVHFHGYSGRGVAMRIDRDKEANSGFDFASPNEGTEGRQRPTIAILPRGNYFGGNSGMGYNFPQLIAPGAIQSLIEFSLNRVSENLGRSLRMARLIITGHSGGGAPVNAVLAHTNPDEVQIFDGLYSSGANVSAWAKRRIAGALSGAGQVPPALRILYLPGSKKYPGTQPNSEAVARSIQSLLADPAAQPLRPFFRVQMTQVAHNNIPATYGWHLLADAGADLPKTGTYGTSTKPSANPSRHEAECETASEAESYVAWPGEYDSELLDEAIASDEQLAWLDVGKEQETDEYGERDESFESLEAGNEYENSLSEGNEAEGPYEVESQEQDAEHEGLDFARYDELGDKRDTEWESEALENLGQGEWENEQENEGVLEGTDLSPAERKAVAITSTFETGKPGGFFGLAGNFDGQGISFGLVNWNIGTGSLQPLLREFAKEYPDRWSRVFGSGATSFREVIASDSKVARATQLQFAIEQMNERCIKRSRKVWCVKEPWLSYFKRLSEDSAFQSIQIRHVRVLLRDGVAHCQTYDLKSEAAFCFMFDAVASHGNAWQNKKKRAVFIKEKLQRLSEERGVGNLPEQEVLLVIADVLGATSAPRWASAARERKRWFVTGQHRRAAKLVKFRPSLDTPFVQSTPGTPIPKPQRNPGAIEDSELAQSIARIAEAEYAKWNGVNGKIRETDDAAMPLLKKYYLEGVKQTVTTTQLKDTAWQNVHPWSSVFISYCLRMAGADRNFRYSTAHRHYIAAAKRNRLNADTGNPFWAYRATEIAPQVGDIICKSRSGSGATYDRIDGPQAFKTHGDIVTEVHSGWIRVLGGNVNQNVDTRRPPIRTLADGRLALDGKQSVYFAVVSCRGANAMPGQHVRPTPSIDPLSPNPAPGPNRTLGKLSPVEFATTFGPAARASKTKHGVPELVTLGQAALESGWGQHAPRFNFFGMKASIRDPEGSRQLLRTREVSKRSDLKFPKVISVKQRPDGMFDYVVCDWFLAFPDAQSSFDAHGSLLSRSRRYAKAFAVGNDSYAFASEIARAGYATAPDYEKILLSVMRQLESVTVSPMRLAA